jgi:hypothetical protein
MNAISILIAASLLLVGCASAPAGWTSTSAVEQLAAKRVPAGSPKKDAEAFFREYRIAWRETVSSSDGSRQPVLVGWAHTRQSLFVRTDIGVLFYLASDGTVERTEVREEFTGL